MRKLLDKILTEIADVDNTMRLIVADIGSFKTFRSKHPNQFINVGVSETNAIGVAAGLASEGMRVFVFGISGFILYRAYEQIKYSVGYWNQPICIIGTGFGWQNYFIGRGHFTPDDIALMRMIPNMKIYTPINENDLIDCLQDRKDCPKYIRIYEGKTCSDIIGKQICESNNNTVVITYGKMAKICMKVVGDLKEQGFDIGIIGLNTLSQECVLQLLPEIINKKIIVIEDHCAIGGLGALMRENGIHINCHLHLPIITEEIAESENELLSLYNMDYTSIKDILIKLNTTS